MKQGQFQSTESADDAEVWAGFWTIQGDFFHCHHNEPRFQLHVPKEETLPVPLKYIDVTRSTYTDLDVMYEKRVEDYWNSIRTKACQIRGKVFTKFSRNMCGPGGRLTEVQTTPRPDHVWPEVWTKIVKVAQNPEIQEWKNYNSNSTMLDD